MRLFEGTPLDRPPRCETCGQLEAECVCPPPSPARIPPAKQTAKIAVEKRKKGKLVTVVRGLSEAGNDLPALLALLKSMCGAGGSIDEGNLEVQGDHRDRIAGKLAELGYRVQRA
jgi:translation initiation factor 1